LKPGEQARIPYPPAGGQGPASRITVSSDIDLEQVMAWKNGLFSFDKTDLKTVMRQLTKWYDVEVEYRGTIQPQLFGGDMQRTLSLSQVLKLLEKSEVHFKIEKLQGGREKIIVTP
jgi:hypothetical protein